MRAANDETLIISGLEMLKGLAGVTTTDGRFTIMMPHPERTFRTVQMSWHPDALGDDSPWLEMFRNARRWLG